MDLNKRNSEYWVVVLDVLFIIVRDINIIEDINTLIVFHAVMCKIYILHI